MKYRSLKCLVENIFQRYRKNLAKFVFESLNILRRRHIFISFDHQRKKVKNSDVFHLRGLAGK